MIRITFRPLLQNCSTHRAVVVSLVLRFHSRNTRPSMLLRRFKRSLKRQTKYRIESLHRRSSDYPPPATPFQIHSRVDEHDIQFVLSLPIPMNLDDFLWMMRFLFVMNDVNRASRVGGCYDGCTFGGPKAEDQQRDHAQPKRVTTPVVSHVTTIYRTPRVTSSGFYKLPLYRNSTNRVVNSSSRKFVKYPSNDNF